MDMADIPLANIQSPQQQRTARNPLEDSLSSAPPAHFLHHHREDDPNYFQGIDAGNQPGYDQVRNDNASASGSGSNGDSSNATKNGWNANHDTLVERIQRPNKIGLPAQHDLFEPPHAPFASTDGLKNRHSRASSVASSADDSEDFDWDTSSDDDDDADQKRGGKGAKITRAKRGRKVYLACLRLARPVRIFLVALIGTAICLVPFIVVTATNNTSAARAQIVVWSIWIAIIWAASCGTFLIIDWIPPLALRLVIAVYGKAPEIVKTYIEAFMATTLYFKLVLCITWAWISLGGVLAIQYSSSSRPDYWRTIFKVIRSLFATSFILLVEKVALQFVAINFHKTAVKDRLEQNQKALKALDKLHESKYLMQKRRFNPMRSRPASPGYKQAYGGQHAAKQSRDGLGGYFATSQQSDANGEKQADGQHHTTHHHPHMHLHRHDGTRTPTEHETQKRERKTNVAAQISDAIAMATMKDSKLYKGSQIGSQRSARKLAKLLFTNLSDHKSTLVAEDFVPYFKSEEEAREAFNLFDADRNGDISKEEMREAVQRIYRERRSLSTSLKDMSSAISKLDGVLMFIGLIIVVFIWLLIFNGDSTVSNIVPLSTFVVGFSFIFGNSAKNIFESMIFIFATHPYDVGDLVCIDEEWMFVKEFGLLSTTFRTTVNAEIVAPNAMLATQKYIYNSRRSGAQWEFTLIQVGFETSLETLEQLRTKLRAWTKENDRDFGGPLDLNFNSITQQNAIELIVAFEHKSNWQDWGARWERRTKLMRRIKTACEELGIVYSMPPQPITFQPKSGPSPFKFGNITGFQQQQQQQQPQQQQQSAF
ncbi:small-conductance mechanosensitive channel protein [Pseudozyma hubeiensis SY62]|uniref:Small-conductance mechanosensitive channel protein n=1 Tax=Pseudozyma hubeiensis (strain SY62) TaxID=1305764 RepID=R9P989_PSEHS|nr:small-conductance mechanosensitive channel protein [Pseudozyma hubeiensis SY62]GAC97926.1 small-conductance mechanosensitive channel protein [Pseudozyma hubeiensis SY62]